MSEEEFEKLFERILEHLKAQPPERESLPALTSSWPTAARALDISETLLRGLVVTGEVKAVRLSPKATRILTTSLIEYVQRLADYDPSADVISIEDRAAKARAARRNSD